MRASDRTKRARRRAGAPGPRPVEELSPRGRQTRLALLASARTVFERDGFLDARITDIAEEASVAHGTFYVYFDSKEAILREVVVQVHSDLMLPITEHPNDAFQLIEDANRHFLDVYRKNANLMVAWQRVASIDDTFVELEREVRTVYARWSELGIRNLQAEGRADAGLDAVIASRALTGMLSDFAYRWFSEGHDYDLETAVAQISRLGANSLGLATHDKLRPA